MPKLLKWKMRVNQALAYNDSRMELACAFVEGIRLNLDDFLTTKKYKDPDELKGIISVIRDYQVLDSNKDIKKLLSVEGELWRQFYKALNIIIITSFVSDKRVKRPPDNPLNAMISFGNMWLYTKTITQLYHTHLDQCISFLHEPSEGRFSLSLDISEVFKIIIVYPVIVNMINKKMISVASHFYKDLNYCHLNEDGRKKFVIELEKKIATTFEHSKLGRSVSYETALKLEGYKLSKHLLEKTPFFPFVEKGGA